jgi:hypothetical protein
MLRERISTRRSSWAGAAFDTNLSPLRVIVTVLNWSLSAIVAADEGLRLLVFDAEAVEHGTQRVTRTDAFFVDELLLVLLEGGDLVCQVRQLQVLRD